MVFGVVAWLAFGAMPAGAQTAAASGSAASSQAPVAATVAVDLTGTLEPGVDRGVLVRTGRASTAPMLAVYIGLSVVGATLALITARRRRLSVQATEPHTGVVVGRRTRAAWGIGARFRRAAPAGSDGVRQGPLARSGVAMLLGSGDSLMIAEHGPPVRAGHTGGATNG